MEYSPSLANAFVHGSTDKRLEVLRLIGATGSISEAAREAGISYKAAWQAIDTLTNLTGVTLVEKAVGGVGGGGAILTRAGEQLLLIANVLEKNREELLKQLQHDNPDLMESTLSRLSIRTSMRNHLPCKVQSLEWSGQIVRVFLDLDKGSTLVARITRASAELLGLIAELPVLALCKAMAVKIDRESDEPKAGLVNTLHGYVVRVSEGDREDEIVVGLKSGLQLVGFSESVKKIQVKDPVVATIDEAAIVVALVS